MAGAREGMGAALAFAWIVLCPLREARAPDVLPLVGEIPGFSNAYVIGAVLGGYTIGPYIGRLLGDAILGEEPERALFPPDRFDLVPAATS